MQTDKHVSQHAGQSDEDGDGDDADGYRGTGGIVEFDGKKDEINDPNGDDADEDPDEQDAEELREENHLALWRIELLVHGCAPLCGFRRKYQQSCQLTRTRFQQPR